MFSLVYITFAYSLLTQVVTNDYHSKREKILQEESELALGGDIQLNDNETIVNKCLMRNKLQYIDRAFQHPEYYNMSNHFFFYKDEMRQTTVYKILKDVPKGAVLHVHDMGILNANYIMQITYLDHLYVCFDTSNNQTVKFRFANKTPKLTCNGRWQLMSDARANAKNLIQFDNKLRRHFTLLTDKPEIVYPNIDKSWEVFMNYFSNVIQLVTYMPVWDQYFYDVLKKLRDDKIMYVEIRSILPELYDLDGSVYDQFITAKSYRKAFKRFTTDYPDFFGAKLIYAPSRRVTKDVVELDLKLAMKIKKDIPDAFAGFDLVGQEDKGLPLIDFVEQLTAASKDLNYFFHAGETDWYGTVTDENLIDAILLGAKRLGHAYALDKHPLLVKQVLEKDIGIEVNVISNNVLSLIHDVRNHPLAGFLAQGLPVVISSDDPGAWEAEPITDDFYVAFVGVASKKADLRMIKKLALNSLKYSALSDSDKVEAFSKFNVQWNDFVNNFKCYQY